MLDDVELGIMLIEIGLALGLDGALLAGGTVSVSIVELFDDLHAFLVDGGEGSETLGIEEGIVLEADEDLGGAGVGAGHGESDVATLVALLDGIIRDGVTTPSSVDRGIGTDAELDDEVGDNAEDDHVVVKMVADKIVDAVGTVGSPGAGDVHDEVAF